MSQRTSEPPKPRSGLSLPTLAKRCRLAAEAGESVESVERVLRSGAPWLCPQLRLDSESPSTLRIWGKSRNDDELARLTITHPAVLRALWAIAEQPFPTSSRNLRSFHAGLLHTYGYLFSTIRTPYGFKRTRWVRPDLERGLGLPSHTLRPQPVAGTLLGNLSSVLSQLLGQTGFVKLGTLSGPNVREEIVRLPRLKGKRLCINERFNGEGGAEYSIHTELLPLRVPKTWLLIYTAGRVDNEKLITTFMIPEAAMKEFLELPLGKRQTIRLRFNASLRNLAPESLISLRGQRRRQWVTIKTD